jgi:[ribosomal protein S18]-alanine N-acetyltransferase
MLVHVPKPSDFPVTLRPATEADIEAIAAIQTAAIWSVMNVIEPGSHAHPGYYEKIIFNAKEDAISGWNYTTIAEVNGAPVAVCILGHNPPLISGLWVRPEAQAQGVGGKLILAALKFFYGQGCSLVTLAVHPRNTSAIKLYERFGFALVTEQTVFSRGLQRDLPQWIMQLIL